MFSNEQYRGLSLPDKTLCLTFDDGPGEIDGDGPGPKTLRLAQYLHSENIRATFFMVGKHIVEYQDLLPEIFRLNHIIGNHTFCHARPLTDQLAADWDIVSEIALTDELIRPFNPDKKIFFRAPWGIWSDEVASRLNSELNNGLDHTGPYFWDIECSDWQYWLNAGNAEDCAKAYVEAIEKNRRGIVLMHDSTTDLLYAKKNNRTYEAIRIMIPELKRLGYSFAGLDEIPSH